MSAPRGGRDAVAWLLLGAMVGSMIAARLETAGLCLAVAALGAAAAGAPWPARTWISVMATGAALAWTLNLFLVPGHALPGFPFGAFRATREGAVLGAIVALRLWGAGAALHGLRAAWPG